MKFHHFDCFWHHKQNYIHIHWTLDCFMWLTDNIFSSNGAKATYLASQTGRKENNDNCSGLECRASQAELTSDITHNNLSLATLPPDCPKQSGTVSSNKGEMVAAIDEKKHSGRGEWKRFSRSKGCTDDPGSTYISHTHQHRNTTVQIMFTCSCSV